MGAFYVSCIVENHAHPGRKARAPKLLVDSGSECTWISERTLRKVGVKPVKKDVGFIMANGNPITRNIGFAILRIGKAFTTDEVVFAQKGDLQLLGARTLEGMNLRVDSRRKKLVAGGPITVA